MQIQSLSAVEVGFFLYLIQFLARFDGIANARMEIKTEIALLLVCDVFRCLPMQFSPTFWLQAVVSVTVPKLITQKNKKPQFLPEIILESSSFDSE